MELPVAIIILLVTLIILALAVYLVATIWELRQINDGLADVLDRVGEIVTKTAPVNGYSTRSTPPSWRAATCSRAWA